MKSITSLKIFLLLIFTSVTYSQQGCWKQTSAGQQHSVAIRNDGTLWAWGTNFHLALGTGTGLDSYIPIQIGTDNNWKQVKAGGAHNLALKASGTLWAWGTNDIGQLGNGTYTNSPTPIQIGIDTDWKEIMAVTDKSSAIKNDGTLWEWGYQATAEPTQMNSNIWKQASFNFVHNMAIKENGTLWTWGSNQYGAMGISGNGSNLPLQVGSLNTWKQVDTGFIVTMAIQTNGTLWAWGDVNSNDNNASSGLLGNSALIGSNFPIQIGTDSNWNKVKCGNQFTLAIKNDGTLWAWGSNFYGQLGDGTTIKRLAPVQIGTDTDWKDLGNNDHYHTTAIKNDGTLWSWGRNFLGALGNGTTVDSFIPILVECQALSTIENKITSFSIYPNPSNDLISIKNPKNMAIDRIVISDLFGKNILETRATQEAINISNLSSGMYIIQIFSDSKVQKEKFIKL